MISGEQLLFEMAVVRGAALAELSRYTEFGRAMNRFALEVGTAFREAAESMRRVAIDVGAAMQRAGLSHLVIEAAAKEES